MDDGQHNLSNINYDKIAGWIVGIAIVEFDVDLGQVVKHLYPQDCLNQNEQKAISHMSFPDSNSFTKAEGSSQYIFRVKRQVKDIENRFCFGFTYFQQKKDNAIQRGYKQQSVVIFTNYPFIRFFNQISEIVGKHTFNNPDNLDIIINQALMDISEWPEPENNKAYSLLFLGEIINLEIPRHVQIARKRLSQQQISNQIVSNFTQINGSPPELIENKQVNLSVEKQNSSILQSDNELNQQSNSQTNSEEKKNQKVKSFQDLNILHVQSQQNGIQSMLSTHDCQEKGFFQEFNIYKIVRKNKVHNLWKIWEIVLTNQPLLIVADSPEECSELVFGAISLISPLEYVGDYRPYFTIYDLEYKTIKDECDKKMTRNIIIGITNPFFLKTLPDFPVVLRFDSQYGKMNGDTKKSSSEKVFPFEVNQKNSKVQINYDKTIDKMLLPIESVETDAINNSLIRKSFRNLTQQFIQTFEDYFDNQKNDIKIFDQKEFFKSLESKKFAFQDLFEKKTKIIQLYEKFLISANFLNYIKQKKNIYFTKTLLKY
ncbi:polarity axis stabilization protein (macronuclear) [Tetrahymena thermophila SB210]|uniref:Polarity axis stabilization protein n=1 Tax=Tetrahymena thermophila (strain SB210) TaxID=312017 RepID=I7M055_TETTS|nr:polarity axis stabilization protein [Tetrahymena thermophila SB210]EAR85516.2 polarity axis stabilization protein [Tetrahymena thermophila SB210]|eukprot:XP_001033179.2 polarity axis stabilization protein [Tetrahymena thermophila SB210]